MQRQRAQDKVDTMLGDRHHFLIHNERGGIVLVLPRNSRHSLRKITLKKSTMMPCLAQKLGNFAQATPDNKDRFERSIDCGKPIHQIMGRVFKQKFRTAGLCGPIAVRPNGRTVKYPVVRHLTGPFR